MDGTPGFFGAALSLLHAPAYIAKGVNRKLENRGLKFINCLFLFLSFLLYHQILGGVGGLKPPQATPSNKAFAWLEILK